MILHYLTTAMRQLMKYKAQNLIAIIGMGLALLCFSVCLYISRFINATDECFERKDEIAQVTLKFGDSERKLLEVPAELTEILKREGMDFPTCVLAYPQDREYNAEVGAEKLLPYTLSCMEVDTAYYQFFTPQITVGTWQQAAHAQNAVVLGESAATRIFGTPEQAIGKCLVLSHRLFTSPQSTPREGGIAYTVQAVMKDMPANTSLSFLSQVHALTLNDSEGRLRNNREGRTGCGVYVMLGKRTIDQCNQEAKDRKMVFSMWDKKLPVCFTTFAEVFWEEAVTAAFSTVTFVAGSLVLLVALLNFFYFLIGSFLTRIREFNIRRVNGAGFGRQFFLLFSQSALAIVIAGCITFVLIRLLSPWLHLEFYELTLSVDPTVLMRQTFIYLVGLLLVCAVLSGIMVAKLRKVNVKSGLFCGTERYGKHRIRNILLGVQLFIGIVFITLTVALYQQSALSARTMFGTLSVEEKEHIVGLELEYGFLNQQQRREIVGRIRQQPGVEDVILADLAYTDGVSGTGMYTQKGDPNSSMDALIHQVSPNFFSFMNIKMESGTVPVLNEAVIDHELARQLNRDVLGMTLYDTADRGFTVKGVCNEFSCSNQSMNGFLFLVTDFPDYFGYCYVKCNPERHAEALQGIEKVMRTYLPENVEPKTKTLMDEIVAEQAMEYELRGIVLYMGLVTLMISLLGIYSAVTLDTERRQKEVAIRKINGAKVRDIALLFARLYIRIVVIASVFAFALSGAILMLMKQSYNSFIDTGVLFFGSIFVVVALLVVALVYMRIWKISRTNPVVVIKNDK